MIAQQKYFDAAKILVEDILPKWYAEIEQTDEYIEKTKAEGKNILYLEIRKNNALKRIDAIENLIEAASIAISQTPQKSNTNNAYTTSDIPPQKRQRLIDMDEGNDWRIKRILTILENEFDY